MAYGVLTRYQEVYTLVQNGNVRKLPFAKCENSHSKLQKEGGGFY